MNNLRGIDYIILLNQLLWTILMVNHWYRGLDWMPIFLLWFIMLGLSITPFMSLFNEDTVHDDEFDDNYLN